MVLRFVTGLDVTLREICSEIRLDVARLIYTIAPSKSAIVLCKYWSKDRFLRPLDPSKGMTLALELYLVTAPVMAMLSMVASVLYDVEFMFRVRVSILAPLMDETGVIDLTRPVLFLS